MNRSLISAFRLVALTSTVWLGLLLCFFYAPVFELEFYPRFIVPAAVIIPLFFSIPIANYMLKIKHEKLSTNELAIFVSVTLVSCGILSYCVETAIVYNLLPAVGHSSFFDAILSPINKRYQMGNVLFGFSFFTSAMLVMSYISLIRIPMVVRSRSVSENTET